MLLSTIVVSFKFGYSWPHLLELLHRFSFVKTGLKLVWRTLALNLFDNPHWASVFSIIALLHMSKDGWALRFNRLPNLDIFRISSGASWVGQILSIQVIPMNRGETIEGVILLRDIRLRLLNSSLGLKRDILRYLASSASLTPSSRFLSVHALIHIVGVLS